MNFRDANIAKKIEEEIKKVEFENNCYIYCARKNEEGFLKNSVDIYQGIL